MGRKQTVGKEKIKEAAKSLFFERGMNGTSMRDVAAKAGCALGLTYKYFENKDILISEVTDDYISGISAPLDKLSGNSKRDPFTAVKTYFDTLYKIFVLIKKETSFGTAKILGEKMIKDNERRLVDIIKALSPYGITPAYSAESAAAMLGSGIGSFIISEDETLYLRKRSEVLAYIDLALTESGGESPVTLPVYAFPSDYDACVKFIDEASKEICAFDKAGLWKRLYVALEASEVVIIRKEKKIIGLCLFSSSTGSIEYISVKDAANREKETLMLIGTACSRSEEGKRLSVKTFDQDIPEILLKAGFENENENYTIIIPDNCIGLFSSVLK